MSQIWNAVKGFIGQGLDLIHSGVEPLFGEHAWGWAIIVLTVIVRVLLIPLAVKQFRSMRAMQELSPQVKAIQKKYKTDRSMMRSDPERYRKIQSKKNEELQALYKEHNVSPAAGCLPLLAQGPIFFALYSVLRDPPDLVAGLSDAPFYLLEPLGETVNQMAGGGIPSLFVPPGLWGLLLILGVAGSMFISQKQMMGRRQTSTDDNDVQAVQQKVMLYAMPLMMGFFGFQLPMGVLLYWVTTNLWTMVQQGLIMREVEDDAEAAGAVVKPGAGSSVGHAGNTRRPAGADTDETSSASKQPTNTSKSNPSAAPRPSKPSSNGRPARTSSSHLPGRRNKS